MSAAASGSRGPFGHRPRAWICGKAAASAEQRRRGVHRHVAEAHGVAGGHARVRLGGAVGAFVVEGFFEGFAAQGVDHGADHAPHDVDVWVGEEHRERGAGDEELGGLVDVAERGHLGLGRDGEGWEGGGTSEVGSVARRATRRGGLARGGAARARARRDEPERRAARAGTETGDGEGASARTAEREATARLASEVPGTNIVVGGGRDASDRAGAEGGADARREGGACVGLSVPMGIDEDARGGRGESHFSRGGHVSARRRDEHQTTPEMGWKPCGRRRWPRCGARTRREGVPVGTRAARQKPKNVRHL